MQLFVVTLSEQSYVKPILEKFKENNFHARLLSAKSLRQALMDSAEPLPYFGGLSKISDGNEGIVHPVITTVVEDEEVKKVASLVKEVVGKLEGNGLMYALPISFVEGLEK